MYSQRSTIQRRCGPPSLTSIFRPGFRRRPLREPPAGSPDGSATRQSRLPRLGRHTLKLSDQDLIYSIGLIDYFSDKFVLSLLNYVYTLLRPGGKVVLGNFHSSNPDKAFMDHVLDWQLIHRAEDDMNRLYAASSFGRPCTSIRFEGWASTCFLECIKSE